VDAIIIHESAILGPTGQTSGFTLGSQYLGSRFHVDRLVEVEAVGGHMFLFQPGQLFGAIVSLSGPTALPSGNPFDATTLATVLFTPPPLSDDILVPLAVTLSPGDYALIFGGEQFGASGQGAMPFNNIDIPGHASYFRWDQKDQLWRNSFQGNTRFVVTGAIPEPGMFALMLFGLTGVAAYQRWRGWKASSASVGAHIRHEPTNVNDGPRVLS